MKNLHLKIKSFIFALTLFLLHVEEAKGIAINAMPLTVPQHLMRHFYFMNGKKPEAGDRYGKLTLISDKTEVRTGAGKPKYPFLCDCGKTIFVRIDYVNPNRKNPKTNCGCDPKPSKPLNDFFDESMIGAKSGKLTLIDNKITRMGRRIHLQYKCDCGNEKLCAVSDVKHKLVQSCGCLLRKYNSSQIEKSIELYLAGKNSREVAEEMNIHKAVVKQWVRKAGVSRELSDSNRRVALNVNCFSEINPETLYWAGMFAADGCVHSGKRNRNSINLTLQYRDIEHLYKFREFCGSEHKINTNERNHSQFSFDSAKVFKDLKQFGIAPNKSFTYDPPEFCCKSPDFWRGMIDGDGHLLISQKKYLNIGLCGSQQTIESFSVWASEITGRKPTVWKYKNKNCYYTLVIGRRAMVLAKELYYDNNLVCLDRKKNKYIEALKIQSA